MNDHTTRHSSQEIPYGYCHCGCGKRTEISPRNDRRWGHIKGEPKLYLPSHQNRLPPEQRFWRSVKRGGEDECWNWQAYTDKLGYARLYIAPMCKVLVHRFSYELHNGPIPEGMFVCHKCDNPSCVNPAHLFVGTVQDNTDDMVNKGRHVAGRCPGESNYRAILTEAIVRAIRQMAADGISYGEIAKQFATNRDHVGMVVRRKIWKHVT